MTRSHRTLYLTLLPALASLAPALAVAGPALPISVEDRGEKVAIFLAGARTTAERPQARSDRLELTLEQAPPVIEIRLADPTVRKVELRAEPPSVRLTLRHGTESTRLSAEMAELRQTEDGLSIVFPRDPRGALARRAAEAPAPAAASGAPAAPAAGASRVDAAGSAAAPAPPFAPASASADKSAPGEAAALAPAVPALDKSAPLDRAADDSGSPLGATLTFGALSGLAAVAWLWLRRKRGARSLTNPLEILAQVSVGPRARVVWISAGRREMLISVSEKDVRVLGQWLADGARAGEAAGPAPAEEIGEPRLGRLPSARLRTNPSLSGLLRLRDQHASIENGETTGGASNADGEGEEPDTEWARQLVAATRRGALR
jgi:Flagellar biosynthesis protein, FliO